MYDCFDNMYQATVGIDFFSKVRTPRHGAIAPRTEPVLTCDRLCISKTERCDYNSGTRLVRSASAVLFPPTSAILVWPLLSMMCPVRRPVSTLCNRHALTDC